jgi:polyisoprenoid-binding protein YceI
MKKTFLGLAIAFTLFSFAILPSIDWTSDSTHSRLGFSINHMGIADVNGEFQKFEVKVASSALDLANSTIEMSADVSSIYTGVEMRDNHLKTADFFDAAKYPTVTFKSTSVTKQKKNTYLIKGNLTMHGITKEISFTAAHNGTVQDEAGKNIAGYKMSGSIKRSDFGVGQPSAGLSDVVKLNCDLEVAQI